MKTPNDNTAIIFDDSEGRPQIHELTAQFIALQGGVNPYVVKYLTEIIPEKAGFVRALREVTNSEIDDPTASTELVWNTAVETAA